ncbi:uncharacterized protein BJ171DRAFT_566386 [Polychytrium aggregatum]|uniref:uncharacterized protein n=1 Tax=Polychytrium aggregatum TaxID=110093 RepID=UPI0022FEBF66|nr:uncharacterized protein BJ171DRAFT_573685 [Polychytrium aggregatum]XP_052969127.1 uncharacterized protein BJ171DRAFT_566386 [Polychytrium aggregatum]KAI9192973.1 hypothetical protein BJ171DRAFT_573685 [Polychytrium aggregatum]KAI9207047.1 hypothetical protein BJ171DRAFT_566386 [Polychytrium aggregatum]
MTTFTWAKLLIAGWLAAVAVATNPAASPPTLPNPNSHPNHASFSHASMTRSASSQRTHTTEPPAQSYRWMIFYEYSNPVNGCAPYTVATNFQFSSTKYFSNKYHLAAKTVCASNNFTCMPIPLTATNTETVGIQCFNNFNTFRTRLDRLFDQLLTASSALSNVSLNALSVIGENAYLTGESLKKCISKIDRKTNATVYSLTTIAPNKTSIMRYTRCDPTCTNCTLSSTVPLGQRRPAGKNSTDSSNSTVVSANTSVYDTYLASAVVQLNANSTQSNSQAGPGAFSGFGVGVFVIALSLLYLADIRR